MAGRSNQTPQTNTFRLCNRSGITNPKLVSYNMMPTEFVY